MSKYFSIVVRFTVFLCVSLLSSMCIASQGNGLDESLIRFQVDSQSQEITVPLSDSKNRVLKVHLERLTATPAQIQSYKKLHPKFDDNYVMYATLTEGEDINSPTKVIWFHYLFLSYFAFPNGIYSAFKVVWSPQRNQAYIIFAQDKEVEGLAIELYEVPPSKGIGITPEQLKTLDAKTLENLSQPISILRTQMKKLSPYGSSAIKSLNVLSENKSLLVAFYRGEDLIPTYFRYNFDLQKWSLVVFVETCPPPPPSIKEWRDQ